MLGMQRTIWLASAMFLLVAMPPLAVAQTTAATKDDLNALEARLKTAIRGAQLNVTANVTAQEAQTRALLGSVFVIVGNISHMIHDGKTLGNLSVNKTKLLFQNLNTTTILLNRILGNVSALDANTLQDHKNLYGSVTDNKTHKPILPSLYAFEQNSNLELRGDVEALRTNDTAKQQDVSFGVQAALKAADIARSRTMYSNVVATLTLVLVLVVFSKVFNVPRRLWSRLDHEVLRTERIGHYVEPPCPAPPKLARAFGGFYETTAGERGECPFAGKCNVAEECRSKAVSVKKREAVTEANGEAELERLGLEPDILESVPLPSTNGHTAHIVNVIDRENWGKS